MEIIFDYFTITKIKKFDKWFLWGNNEEFSVNSDIMSMKYHHELISFISK